jgi:PPOX class probable F420-dependent enzyme
VSSATAFLDLADARFTSLTTFRRSGEAVSTPVWVGREGDTLVVTTPRASGKVKRLRNDPRVELRPCSRRGKVEEGVAPLEGVAELLGEDSDSPRIVEVIRRKYGLEFRVFMAIERLFTSGNSPRVGLRIATS